MWRASGLWNNIRRGTRSRPLLHRHGQFVTALSIPRALGEQIQFRRHVQRRAYLVKRVDKGNIRILVECDTETSQPFPERIGGRARKERVLAMAQARAVRPSGRPLPHLLGRVVARVDQDVLVDCSRDLRLRPAKQTTVLQNATIASTMEDLKATLLSDRYKIEVDVNIDGRGT
jgi:hypothetical protein